LISAEDQTKSIDYFVSKMGIGTYQYTVYFLMGLFFFINGIQLMAYAIMNPVLEYTMNYTSHELIVVNTSYFIGMLIGSVIAGHFSDKYGRKPTFTFSIIALLAVWLFSIWITSFWLLTITRFLVGLATGILMPVTITICTEITPVDKRGKVILIVDGFFCIGMIATCLISIPLFTTPQEGNWELLFIILSIPVTFASLIAVTFLKESPRYAIFKNFQRGVMLLNLMKDENLAESLSVSEADEASLKAWLNHQEIERTMMKSGFKQLFKGQYTRITILLWLMWFMINFANIGIILTLPATFSRVEPNVQMGFLQIAIAEIGQASAMIACYFVIDNVNFGRKKSLVVAFSFCTFGCIAGFFAHGILFTIFMFGVKFGISCVYGFIYPLTSEMYHTKVRSTGVGFASAIGGLGGVLVQLAAVPALKISPYLPYMIFGLSFLVGGIATALLPHDTTGRELDIVEKKNSKGLSRP